MALVRRERRTEARPRRPSNEITYDEFCEMFLVRHGVTIADSTRETLAGRLAHSRERFGGLRLRELEGASSGVAAWRAEFPAGARYRATSAMRQALAAAVRWKYLDRNPAADAGKNPQPRVEDVLPFAPGEVAMITAELDPLDAARVIVAAETGLRPEE